MIYIIYYICLNIQIICIIVLISMYIYIYIIIILVYIYPGLQRSSLTWTLCLSKFHPVKLDRYEWSCFTPSCKSQSHRLEPKPKMKKALRRRQDPSSLFVLSQGVPSYFFPTRGLADVSREDVRNDANGTHPLCYAMCRHDIIQNTLEHQAVDFIQNWLPRFPLIWDWLDAVMCRSINKCQNWHLKA